MLSVKIGQFHPSLENSFVNTIQTLKRDDPLAPLAVVTPTNWMLNRLQERLVHEQDASFMNISFMNFYALANEVCRRSGTDTGKIIQQSVIYECLIAGLLKRHTLPGSVFKNAQSLPSLASALFQAIRDLADANVDANDLKAAIREGFIDGAEMQKLYGVVHLYDMFRQKLKTLNISHFSDLYRLAATCVSDSRFLKGFQCILVYGLYDPTGAEQDFFGEIFRSHPTTLFLPYQKKHPAFSYVKPFFESFVLGLAHDIEEIATDNGYGFSYIIDPTSKDTNEEMRILTASQTRNPNIHIINASGKRDEVWIVAKEILKLLDEGYKMEEIGVVARTLEPYTDAIKKIFQENRIPFTTNSEETLERYPLVKVIRQLLLLKRENYYRPIVVELLGSPYFKTPSFDRKGVTPRPDLWDLLSRRAGIRGDIKRWLSRLEQWKAASTEALNMDNEIAMSKEGTRMSEEKFTDNESERRVHIPLNQIEFLENTLRMLSNDLSSLPEKASWTVMSQKTTHLLQRYICVPLEGMNREEQKRDQQILNKISELLHALCIMDCLGEEVTQDQFVDAFINACRQEGLPIGIESGRGVKVMDAMSARGVPFRALFVLGLNEKVFPRAISEEPFLRDHVRRRLSEVLGNHIPEKLRGFDEERLLFYFLLNAARERLYLLYERSDEAGKPKIPSHYLMDIRQNIKESLEEKTKYEVYVPRGIKDKLCNKEYSLLTPKEIGIRMALDRIDPDYFRKAFGLNRDAFARSQSALGFMESYNPQLTAY
ncbi:MAG: exodeoxyribonuclease V subunit gamma, partial [Planctomycetes bacterium]|nr:exodeoxyribonuclease V subunit gamma [Planctomycetota bacterium]